MSLPLRKDVPTGRDVLGDPFNRLGYRRGQAWFEVHAYRCLASCVCDGIEVCLRHVKKYEQGGGATTPMWPVLTCETPEEAEALSKKLTAFARGMSTQNPNDFWDERYHGDRRLGQWLEERGYERRNHIVWGPG